MDPTKSLTGEFTPFFPLALLSLILVLIFRLSFSKGPPVPPGPYAWPIVGNIFEMGELVHVTLANLAQVHGPLMSLRFGSRLVVVGSSPAVAAEILKSHDRSLSGRKLPLPIRFKGSKLHNLGLGFFDECGDGWRSIRTVYRGEVFWTKALDSQAEVREKKVNEMVAYLESKEGEVVKIKEVVFATALNILSNIFLSVDFLDYEGKGVAEGMRGYIRRFAVKGSTDCLSDIFPVLGDWCFRGTCSKLMDVVETIFAAWVGILKERRESTTHVSDLLDFLMGNGFTNEQINPLLLELFSAGTDSTSATTEWALVELIRNRIAMQKLRHELAKAVGGDTVKERNLPNLPYLEACIKETLRLHPPGPLLLPHRAVQTCEVMGYTIPKDSEVLVNMWAIGRDPTIWDEPMSFKPERFLNSMVDFKGHDFKFIPFGSGRRMCPGQPLASRVVPFLVASLIQRFDWSLPNDMDPSQIDMSEMYDITMQKKETLSALPKRRIRDVK
ncbi:hypothetical protein RJ639_028928 [Escallonia herrerae]|uniref:Cytochrome P450 n=1 Tax=Escallonia herrerae TaxID=1293975 RepID=A0AA89BQG5_9ASTE|nr:hypothetical protein RJ639_028928 [Escallonia herrerae]